MSLDDDRHDDDDYRELRPRPFEYGQVACDLFMQELRQRGFQYKASSTKPTKDGDGGWDFKVNGKFIDIKRRPADKDCLLVEIGKAISDVFVLYLDETPVGYASKKLVMSKAPRKWPDKIINHAVHISELGTMERFWDILQQHKPAPCAGGEGD